MKKDNKNNTGRNVILMGGVVVIIAILLAVYFNVYQNDKVDGKCQTCSIDLSAKDENPSENNSITIDENLSDAEKFSLEYPEVSPDNPFVYIGEATMMSYFVPENKLTGIVYFGFPNCPWCQQAMPLLEAAAKENNTAQIYYFNPTDFRKPDSENYQTLLSYTSQYLDNDDNGNPKLFVPEVFFIKDGVIVNHHTGTLDSQVDPSILLTEAEKMEVKQYYATYLNSII